MEQAPNRALTFRALGVDDSAEVQRLVIDCPPLSPHTPYTYWVILSKFGALCVGAFADATPVGIALAIATPEKRAFVWQVGVRPQFRGLNLGGRLLEQVWKSAKQQGLQSIEATISHKNEASRRTFESFARANHLAFRAIGQATASDASGSIVDQEVEYRMEPHQD